MRIAVVGSGIAGLGAAWLLSREHEVVLFEAQSRLGGHTHTHRVERDDGTWDIDSGFIVFNPANYPLLTRLFAELDVATQPTTMSFSVHNARSGLEYNAGTLAGLFCQKRNLVSRRFWRMLRDLVRFYREAPALLDTGDEGPTLGDYLEAGGYSPMFVHDHLVPMASALWSSPSTQILRFPARYLVQFMANHHMLQTDNRPEWRVVRGGSSSYVRALVARWNVQVRLDAPALAVRRTGDGVMLRSRDGIDTFDHVVLACHADQALAIVADASEAERDILGAMTYQPNATVLHTDRRMLPRNPRAWAAWNAYVPAREGEHCTVSYCMNLLQSIQAPVPFVVTLNRSADIDPASVIARMDYMHPVYTHASVAAQQRRHEIDGVDRISYCGAYWGWGFHEDGLRSAVQSVGRLGVRWP